MDDAKFCLIANDTQDKSRREQKNHFIRFVG
jgi:hypothetical protein